MSLFKCLVPVLVVLLVEGSSARPGESGRQPRSLQTGNVYQFRNGHAISNGIVYWIPPVAGSQSTANQGNVLQQSGPGGKFALVPFEATNAVPAAGVSSGNRTDGSDGSSAYRQDIVSAETLASLIVEAMKSNQGPTPISPELSRAISIAISNASGGSASSSGKSTANGSGNAMRRQPAAQYQRTAGVQHPAMLRPAQTPTSNR